MIFFFRTPSGHVIATETDHTLTAPEAERLGWLFGGATLVEAQSLPGRFVGPRREMVSPWSTNAVEITQNMGLAGITRIEEYVPLGAATASDEGGKPAATGQAEEAGFDPMLQRHYEGLDQGLFTVGIKPAPVRQVTDLDAYNEQEGLALSAEEVEYLHGVERQLGRALTEPEVFGFAQINSEHCRHKIFGGEFIIDGVAQPASLFELIKRTTRTNPHHVLSAYRDNVAFLLGPVVEQFAPADHSTSGYFRIREIESILSLKAETHNFPTTVEPFNGAATGTGGEIRDRMAGGTGSWPLVGTAVYMTAYPRLPRVGAEGHDAPRPWEQHLAERPWLYQTPEQILIKASNGASDFGNKFGQPLVAGSVLTFEYLDTEAPGGKAVAYAYDKVVMLAGGVGYANRRDCQKREPQKGDKIVVVGGDNYRIGLGGGSVSSVDTGRYSSGIELNAVQRANPEMQKRANNLVRALCEEESNPIVSIHDHGSAGHVNCLSELVGECGGEVEMDKLPIGDKTLSATEIIANESQERMGLLIDSKHLDHVRKIAERERAPLYVVGEATGDAHFSFVRPDGTRPFDLDVAQMFGHSPKTVMVDQSVAHTYPDVSYDAHALWSYLSDVLQLEAVACKDWLTNKVDRSVTGKVARQQCQGALQLPLSDCGVVALDYRGRHGIATSIGHAPQAGLANAAAGSVLSVSEALTNLVWAPLVDGLDSVSLSANWMWPCRSQQGEDARLYEAVAALSDFCVALQVNVPTGKDSLSLSQQYPDGSKVISPGTVIVSAGGEVEDVRRVVSPVIALEGRDGKAAAPSSLYYIDFSGDVPRLGGSAFAQSRGKVGSDVPTVRDAAYFRAAFNAVQELVRRGLLLAGHDVSAGGLITCLLEMTFGNTTGGLDLSLDELGAYDTVRLLFAENPAVVVQVADADAAAFRDVTDKAGVRTVRLGRPTSGRDIAISHGTDTYRHDIDALRETWYATSYLLDRKQSLHGCAALRRDNYKLQPLRFRLPGDDAPFSFSRYGITPERRTASGVRAAIIREKGTNGEREMAYALYLAGFDVKDVTMTDLVTGRETLEDIQMAVFCGGFSNSDVLGSAKGWAGAFLFNPKAKAALDAFYAREDTLSLGVCNGCQLMVELGLVGATKDGAPAPARMLHNDSRKFESAFLGVTVPQNRSVMLGSLSGAELGIWVAHGEGRFSLPGGEERYNVVLKYSYHAYPGNPNGSDYDAAGIATADGRHLAMMPHLERAFLPWQCGTYPAAHRGDDVTPWIEAFVNARRWCEAHHA